MRMDIDEEQLQRPRGMSWAGSSPSGHAPGASSPLRAAARPLALARPHSLQVSGSSELLGAGSYSASPTPLRTGPYSASPTPLRAGPHSASPTPLRPPQAPNSTPTALRPPSAYAQPPPLNSINLAAQLAQLNFGRACSPAALRLQSSGGSDSPLPDSPLRRPPFVPSLDSPLHRPVQPFFSSLHLPIGSGPPTPTPTARSGGFGGNLALPTAPAGDVVIDISPGLNPYLLHYASPAPKDGRTIRCSVLRTRGQKRLVTYRMVTEAGEELLSAVRRQDDFLISMTSSDLPFSNQHSSSTADWGKAERSSFSLLQCPPDGATSDDERREFFAFKAVHNGRELQRVGEPIMALSHGTVVARADLPQSLRPRR
ncbi:hypothetical protein T492DRAFT_863478 [Pavlovales sp. CCMP2436]|nr:hypothetical protein T492DRAFT_863478 [Pavlovales sp. CCMP2436]